MCCWGSVRSFCHCLIGAVSRAVAGKCVCHGQRLFYMCTCGAGPIYRITVAWSARRQSSLHTRYSCMCRSRAPIRAALRFVEIANKAICDRNSPAVLREQAQFGAQWFVMSVHSPQQTTGAPRAVVLSQPKKSPMSARAEERTRVCLSWMWALSSPWAGYRGHPHDTTSLALPCCVKCEPRARTVHTLRIAGRGWHISGLVSVATSTAVLGALVSLGCEETLPYQRPLPPVHQSGQPGLCTVVCVYQHQGQLVSARHALRMMMSPPKQRRMASCAACGRPMSSRQHPFVCR